MKKTTLRHWTRWWTHSRGANVFLSYETIAKLYNIRNYNDPNNLRTIDSAVKDIIDTKYQEIYGDTLKIPNMVAKERTMFLSVNKSVRKLHKEGWNNALKAAYALRDMRNASIPTADIVKHFGDTYEDISNVLIQIELAGNFIDDIKEGEARQYTRLCIKYATEPYPYLLAAQNTGALKDIV